MKALNKIILHLVFTTKHRTASIKIEYLQKLHAYLGSILTEQGCIPIMIGGVEDHVHVLFQLNRTEAPSHIVMNLKRHSSRFLKSLPETPQDFQWQSGYAVFSVSESMISNVSSYIANQREHHKAKSLNDEIKALAIAHRVALNDDEDDDWA